MAKSPDWKIYREGEYVASCKYAEDAAAVVGVSGGVVKWRHNLVVWREGEEKVEASQSYDEAATTMYLRLQHAKSKAVRHAEKLHPDTATG